MNKLFSIVVGFVFAAFMFIGCDSDSSDNSGLALALLMSQPKNAMSGSATDVSSGSQGTGAASAASGAVSMSALMSAMDTLSGNIVADGTTALVKENVQKSIEAKVAKKAITIGDRKADTTPVDITFTEEDATSLAGATITPNISVTGTITQTELSETEGVTVLDLSMTGTVTTVFADCEIYVLDVYNFILNNELSFITVTLTGTTNTTSMAGEFKMRMYQTLVSVDTETGDMTFDTSLTSSSNSTSETAATNLQITVGTGTPALHSFAITATDRSSSKSTGTMVIGETMEDTVTSFSGSMVQSVEGTVDENPVSYTIVLKNAQLQEYQNIAGTQPL